MRSPLTNTRHGVFALALWEFSLQRNRDIDAASSAVDPARLSVLLYWVWNASMPYHDLARSSLDVALP